MTLDAEPPDTTKTGQNDLIDAIIGLDEDRMRHLMHTISETYGTDFLVADLLVPTLHTIGDMWQDGKLSVMHEHFASSIIRSAAGEFRRSHIARETPHIVLGCLPGELHDLPCHLFALMLLERGLNPLILGANTPPLALANAVRATNAVGCVVTAMRPRSVHAHRTALLRMSKSAPVYLAGPAAEVSTIMPGTFSLPRDWRAAADLIAS